MSWRATRLRTTKLAWSIERSLLKIERICICCHYHIRLEFLSHWLPELYRCLWYSIIQLHTGSTTTSWLALYQNHMNWRLSLKLAHGHGTGCKYISSYTCKKWYFLILNAFSSIGNLRWEQFHLCYWLFKWHDRICKTSDQSHILHVLSNGGRSD